MADLISMLAATAGTSTGGINPREYFNTVLFTGNAPTGQSITGVGFAPDLTWFKSRTIVSPHNLVDKVRGAFRLRSSTTDAETSATVTLDSDGFTVSATGSPIVICSGGAGPTGNCSPGAPGSNSTGLGYVTIGGGHGGGGGGGGGAEAGGSGGGGGGCNGGTVTGTQPSQSNPGATNFGNPGGPGTRGGGGGGAGGAGSSGPGGAGGAGLDVSPTVGPAPLIPNSGVYSAGGGGQAGGTIGAANTGNGGGGDCHSCGRGAGGSGIVIIKYKFQ